MKFLHSVLPNLCIAFNLALIVVILLDLYNPLMGFTHGLAFLALFFAGTLSSLATAVCMYADWRKKNKQDEDDTNG